MTTTKEEKKEEVKGGEDTGGVEAQTTTLSKKIEELLSHLKKHPKDLHSRRGLLAMVNKRRKLLSYLKRKDEERYRKLLSKLGLKK